MVFGILLLWFQTHDNIIKWKHFQQYWPLVRRIRLCHRWIVIVKVSDAELLCFFNLCLSKRVSKQLRYRWFETPWHSLWHDCNDEWHKSYLSGHPSWWNNCWSNRCSWSIAWRRWSNYIFLFDLPPGFMGLGKDNYAIFYTFIYV